MYANFNDTVVMGTYVSRITVENLIDASKVVEKNDGVDCIVDKDRFFEMYESRYTSDTSGIRDDFERMYDYISEEDVVVMNTYFNVNTKQFEKQIVRFIFER